MNDLYGDKDFSGRDQELQRLIPTLKRFLPNSALATLADAVELDALAEQMDSAVAAAISALSANAKLVSPKLTHALYQQGYQAAHRAPESRQARERQFALVGQIAADLDRLVKKPLVGKILNGMGPVAQAAHLAQMHDFLKRGFTAFAAMQGATEFTATVLSRERTQHARMLAEV